MVGAELQSHVVDALRARDFAAVRQACTGNEPPDLAELIHGLEPADRAVLFRLLPRDTAGSVFEYLDAETQEALIKSLGQEDVAGILNQMSPDDRTALLEELPAAVTKQILGLLSPQERAIAVKLLGYPEDSIGRLMTPDYVKVRPDWTVERVLEHVRRFVPDIEAAPGAADGTVDTMSLETMLKRVQPGDYVLQIVVTDKLAKEKRSIATQFVQFEIQR